MSLAPHHPRNAKSGGNSYIHISSKQLVSQVGTQGLNYSQIYKAKLMPNHIVEGFEILLEWKGM